MNITWRAGARWVKCKVAPDRILVVMARFKNARLLSLRSVEVVFGKVTHSAARFVLIKPELRRNSRYSVALNQCASVHSLTRGCLTQIQTAAEPESLSPFLSVPEQHSGGVSLWNTRRSPAR